MIYEMLIPVGLFLVIGAVLLAWIYYRSKERQLIIEKGMTTEQIKEFLRTKRDPYILIKMGIIILFFGLGLGAGMFLEEIYPSDLWVPFFLFAFVGAGFIVAFNVSRKMKIEDKKNKQEVSSNNYSDE